MSPELYAAYLAACVVLVLVPGPTVTLTIANSLKHGTRAGLLSVAGTQLGLASMLAIVGVGLTSLVEAMGHWFDWLRLAGAAYLVWLGWKMIRGAGREAGGGTTARRLPAARRPGRPQQSQDPIVLRCIFSTVRRSGARLRSPDLHHGGDSDGGRSSQRQRLCAGGRPRTPRLLGTPCRHSRACQRRIPDWRRPLARLFEVALSHGEGNGNWWRLLPGA